jgi:hypothetical protein
MATPNNRLIVPKAIIQNMHAQFLNQAKKFCKDLAYIGDVPKELEKSYTDKILTKLEKMEFVIYRDDSEPYCPVPVKRNAIIECCRLPSVLGTSRCIGHQHVSVIPTIESETEYVRLCPTEVGQESLFWDEETNRIYNNKMEYKGNYEDGVVEIFTVEEDDSAS